MQQYFDNILSRDQYCFRKGYNSQHCLITMIVILRGSIGEDGAFNTLLTDLSKAFHCLPHELLIATLHEHGFDMESLNFMCGYLSNRKKRVKVGRAYSSWREILYGFSQGSILGPLLFNIFLCDLFYFLEGTDIVSHADNTTASV